MQTEKQLKFNIEFDGNDGTGKTYVINLIKQFFNNCIFKDRGIFSKATLLNKESEEKMYDYIDNNIDSDTLYIILDDFPEHCQQRIQKRGDSLDEEFHTLEDLEYYRKSFMLLYNHCKEKKYSNVYLVSRIPYDSAGTIIEIIRDFIKKQIMNKS